MYVMHIDDVRARFEEICASLPSGRRERIERMRPEKGKLQTAAAGYLLQTVCGIDEDADVVRDENGKPQLREGVVLHAAPHVGLREGVGVYASPHVELRKGVVLHASPHVRPCDEKERSGQRVAMQQPAISSQNMPLCAVQPDAVYTHFNLSHGGEYVVLALSDAPVGVDVEPVGRRRESIERRIFTEEERQFMADYGRGLDEAFAVIWTLKESVMKADGRGLAMNPREVSAFDAAWHAEYLLYDNHVFACAGCGARDMEIRRIR